MVDSSKVSNGSPAAPPSLKKSSSSSKNQTSIAGFFRKKDPEAVSNGTPTINGSALPLHVSPKKKGVKKLPKASNHHNLTPAPSSDAVEDIEEEQEVKSVRLNGAHAPNGLPSPVTPASIGARNDVVADDTAPKGFYSPPRKVRFRAHRY